MSAKTPQFPKEGSDLPTRADWNALKETAAFLEKARMAEYVAIMSDPRKNIWLNFVAGVARGVGMVVGVTIIGGLMFLGLKKAFVHAGGVPWIGAEMKEVIGTILQAAKEHSDKVSR